MLQPQARQAADLTPEQFLKMLHDVEGFDPADLIPSAISHFPNPAWEAHQLVRMIGRGGSTAENLRDLIAVAPDQEAYLLRVTEKDPLKRRVVDLALAFRRDVRAAFDAELADPHLATAIQELEGEP